MRCNSTTGLRAMGPLIRTGNVTARSELRIYFQIDDRLLSYCTYRTSVVDGTRSTHVLEYFQNLAATIG